MKQIIINGGKTLSGEIKISGAKNSAVALIPATLLADDKMTLCNIPNILDKLVKLQDIVWMSQNTSRFILILRLCSALTVPVASSLSGHAMHNSPVIILTGSAFLISGKASDAYLTASWSTDIGVENNNPHKINTTIAAATLVA